MNEVSKSVTDHLIKLQELTQTNLDLLNTLNDALFTKQEHLSVKIGDNITSIPSFLSLENKINNLQANFENLVNAPLTGEAFFNFDGNSRAIEVRSYTTVPNKLTLNHTNKENPITSFQVEKNNKFKDFLNPLPYINLDLSYYLDDNETPAVPNDINTIIVKKIIPISSQLKEFFKSKLVKYEDLYKDGVLLTEEVTDEVTGEVITKAQQKEVGLNSISYEYTELYKKLSNFTKDIDYIEYDSKYEFPTRKNIGHAIYVIKSITEDIIDEDTLFEYLTIQLRNDIQDNENVEKYSNTLTYKLFDETIEKPLAVGDQLITYEGNAKLEITNINTTFNEITVKVLNGEYVNLFECKDPKFISNSSKLRFYKPIDFSQDRIIKVPLEEDQFIYITAAALNNRMNVQSAWGSGLMINTYSLTANDVNINKDINFGNYYTNYVNNMGDILTELSHIMSNTLEKYTKTEFESFTQAEPSISEADFEVVQINKHLDSSPTIKSIRSKYSEKKDLERKLNNLQSNIDRISDKLNSVSFDDTTGLRNILTNNLNNLLSRKDITMASITSIINEISELANSSVVPIENAKYRIRGFFNYKTFLEKSGIEYLNKHIRGIRVQYRYKNLDQEQGNAMSFKTALWQYDNTQKKFILKTPIFSDWNNMTGFDNDKVPYYDNGYKYDLMSDNFDSNEPSWNQIDIPISQGETVDIRLRVVYDMGYPFVETSSAWSNIINIKFPEEYTTNVEILDIIEENNDDIETNKINNILNNKGITSHISNNITDQNITYFHQPENIASGFYTSERRIIPLKDKLSEMHNDLVRLIDVIEGSAATDITVTLVSGNNVNTLSPLQTTNILTTSYDSFEKTSFGDDSENSDILNGNYIFNSKNGVVSTVFNLDITNTSNHSVNIYPIFPGPKDKIINKLIRVKTGLHLEDYCVLPTEDPDYFDKKGVWYKFTDVNEAGQSFTNSSLQTANQLITFRIKDIFDGTPYYIDESEGDLNIGQSNCNSLWDNNSYADAYKSEGDNLKSINFAFLYPKLNDRYGIHLPEDNTIGYKVLNPGDKITIPIVFEYKINSDNIITVGDTVISNGYSKTMSFDVRTSLYSDPINYTFRIIAKYQLDQADKVILSQNSTTTDVEASVSTNKLTSAWGNANFVLLSDYADKFQIQNTSSQRYQTVSQSPLSVNINAKRGHSGMKNINLS